MRGVLTHATFKATATRRMVCRRAIVPEHDARHVLKEAIQVAKDVCNAEDVSEIDCILAWDTVDDIGRGISKREEIDPLEVYCNDHEDADECRVYDL